MKLLQVFSVALHIVFASCADEDKQGVSKESRIRGAFFGALVADALTLGSHYEYDAPTIKKAYGGTIHRYMAPGEMMGGTTHGVGWGRRNYHPGQKAGDQTDYGEYNILVLSHLAKRKNKKAPIELAAFIPLWKRRLESPKWGAWKCTMTRQALEQVNQGVGYQSLGGMSNAMSLRHMAAHAVFEKETEVVQAARTVMFTHLNSEALGGGEFFARVVHKIIHDGMDLMGALTLVGDSMGNWYSNKVKQGVKKFQEVTDPNSQLSKEEFVDDLASTSMARLWEVGKSEPIKVGKASPTEGTLPTSVYLILKYQNNFVAGVKANAMIGGDSASRAIAVGGVLGAYHGVDAIPHELRSTLNAWDKCNKMMNRLPLLADHSEL